MKVVNIITLLICLTLNIGCKRDSAADMDYADTRSVVITMDICSAGSPTRAAVPYSQQAGVLGDAEYTVDRLRVYVFSSTGKLDKMEYYDGLNANHLIDREIKVPMDKRKELYFVANEPESLTSTLEGVTSAEDLEQLEFVIADGLNKGFNGDETFAKGNFHIPMTAKYSLGNAMADVNIYVGLERAVARVDLYLVKSAKMESHIVELDDTTALSAEGVTYGSNLFDGVIGNPTDIQSVNVASSSVVLDTKTPKRVLSFYLAERMYDFSDANTQIKIEVDGLIDNGVSIDPKSVVLGDEGNLSQLERNYVYRITGEYTADAEEEIVATDFKILDWVDVEIDGEIEGVMMAVDSEVAMDWLLNGNSYESKTISFGSNKPIKFYMPVAVSGEGGVPDCEFRLFEFDNMRNGASYDLMKIALPNNYIFVTNWIEEATIHFTSLSSDYTSGYIKFKYKPSKVNYKIQNYPIRLKSDNVMKQMKAVYDNGYIPASLLSDTWADRAPGGVIFAKRGFSNNPLDTPEISHRDDDGYYRGDFKTTADDASRYCTDEFGQGWYVPSYAEMKDLASLYDMLGVSYRLQNNGSDFGSGELTESRYWTSSASSAFEGKYWSADFMSRDYMINDLLERRDKTESHFVRCVRDLQ